MSAVLLVIGAVGTWAAGLVTILEVSRIAFSDSTAKLEKSLGRLIVFCACAGMGIFIAFAGWTLSYPTHLVNGKPRSDAPETYTWLFIGLMFLAIVLAALCAVVKYRVKKRRMAPLEEAYKRRMKMLISEFGSDSERIIEILERTGVFDELHRADREGD